MAHDLTYAYAGDLTAKRNEKGALIVYGKATGPDLDLDQQICDPEWLAKAMPEWMKIGNIREQHQAIAAGIGLELSSEGKDWMLKAEVVDESTARKVEKKVLKGFSIGIKNARVVSDVTAPNGRIVAGDIVEVSLVDRPANPTALIEIAKSVGDTLTLMDVEIEKSDVVPQDVVEVNIPAAKDSDDMYPAELPCPACNGKGEYVCNAAGETHETCEVCDVCNGTGHAPIDLHADAGNGSNPAEFIAEDTAGLKALTKGLIKSWLTAASEPETVAAFVGKAIHDEATLNQIREGIVTMIKNELDEMLMGEEDEIADVQELLCSLQMFLCWWKGEADEQEVAAPFTMEDEELEMAYIGMGLDPEIIKAVGVDKPTDEAKELFKTEIIKALGVDEEIVKLETTLSEKQEAIKSLEATVAEMKNLASGGGPKLRQTTVQAQKSADSERLFAEAARMRSIAEQIENQDMRMAYISKALELEKDATSIQKN